MRYFAFIAVLAALAAGVDAADRAGVDGPYAGRVLDAETGSPVRGALILIVWGAERPDGPGRQHVTTRDALTDAHGAFRVETPFVATLPARTSPPDFYVFGHGHLPFPDDAWDRGAATAPLRAGATIGLRRAVGDEERARAFNTLLGAQERWRAPGPAPGAPAQPPLLLLEQYFGEELESFGLEE